MRASSLHNCSQKSGQRFSAIKRWDSCVHKRPCSASVARVEAPPAEAQATHRYSQILPAEQQAAEIRSRVLENHLSGGLLYVDGGDLLPRNGYDVYHKFRANSYFTYLTGVQEPGFACLLDTEAGTLALVCPKHPPEAAIWTGGLPSLQQLAEDYGADHVLYKTDLAAYMRERHSGMEVHALPSQAEQLRQQLDVGASVSDYKLQELLDRCRAAKTDAEVACLMRANAVSAEAHLAMWRACRPGMYEYQLEAAFVASAMHGGLRDLGYPAIVCAGRNAAVLHYERNSCQVGPQDLVLVDAGAEFRSYTADITRTFPASGSFTAQQREIYELTSQMQQAALELMQPGAIWADVQRSCRRLMLQGLLDLGLVKGSVDALLAAKVDQVFMPHGLGHYLGLDVHDVSYEGPVPTKLLPGHVVTCEPGIYFMELLLQRAAADDLQAGLINMDVVVGQYMGVGGVRIEDNVLVTERGNFNITMEASGLAKDAAEVEQMMRG